MICPCSTSNPKQRRRSTLGWTLVEMMVGTGIGSLILIAAAQITMFTARSFIAMGNYNDLDRASRNALDVMSSEIRGARTVGSFATNQLVLTNIDGTVFSYSWDPSTGNVTRQWGSERRVLLTGCDYLSFDIFQRNPTNGSGLWFPWECTTNPPVTKLVNLSWKCSRQILAAKVNTESVQTAKIVIRN
jgi:type II secretory pathway pseudopilin PulG